MDQLVNNTASYPRQLLLLLPLALQPVVGFGLSNNVPPFCPICHHLSPSSHSQYLKISFYFFSPSFLGLPPCFIPSSFWVKIFLGILSSSILSRWPKQLILYPFIHFTTFSPLLISSSSQFVILFHSPFSYLGQYILLNILRRLESSNLEFIGLCFTQKYIPPSN